MAASAVLLAEPTFFDVTYVINPHMAGAVGTIDRVAARHQWEALRSVYQELGLVVEVLEAVQGLSDLVFVANQCFPFVAADGAREVLLSQMRWPERRPEVAVVADWFARRGITARSLQDPGVFLEGMGDIQWHPSGRALLGGHGFRTSAAAYDDPTLTSVAPVHPLKLVDEQLYHLDTCLSPIDEHTAVVCFEAFDEPSREVLRGAFDQLIEVPYDEAVRTLACNGHCPDGKHFIVHHEARVTAERVRQAGYEVVEVDTSEFLKSGGSVQCMKLMLH
ncbi:MAG: hypothetical protein KTR31_40400 [Myxococcales bacterium]|nr:hypothetical protein [Myxococcales bacterium]